MDLRPCRLVTIFKKHDVGLEHEKFTHGNVITYTICEIVVINSTFMRKYHNVL